MTTARIPNSGPGTVAPGVVDGLLDEDPMQAMFRVHRKAFTDAEVFAAEQETFWEKEWLYLGHESELPNPGAFKRRTLAGRDLLMVRSGDGEVRVFLNVCPHRGTTVCRQAEGDARYFTCFYHAWSFDNSGKLVTLPDQDAYVDDPGFKDRMGLREVPRQDVYRGFIFVSFAVDGPPLEDALAGAREALDLVADQSPLGVEVVSGTHLYTSRTNWKLAVNALDGYHFSPTHATFIEYRKASGWIVNGQGGWADLDRGHLVFESHGFYGRSGLNWEPSWGEDERLRIEGVRAELTGRLGEERAARVSDWSRNTYVFPNLIIFDFAGVFLRTIEPVAPGVTEFRAHEFAPVGEPPEARRMRLDNILTFVGPGGFATPDDLEAQQSAQRGYETTANDPRPGVAWSDVSRGYEAELRGEQTDIYDEGHIRAFWRHWYKRLSGMDP